MVRILWYLMMLLTFWASANAQQAHNQRPQYEFVANQGQFHPLVRFRAEIPYGNLYLENNAMMYDLMHPDDYHASMQFRHDHPGALIDIPIRRHTVRIQFMQAERFAKASSIDPQPHHYNYYLGDDPSQWVTGIHPSAGVRFENVFEDVDFEINGHNDLKYQWVVRNPTPEKVAKLEMRITGADSIIVDNEQLNIYTSVGMITDGTPYVYQIIDGQERHIKCAYSLEGNVVNYHLLGDVMPGVDLIIDPELIFSTYSGSVGDNFGFTATYDSRGNLYAGGIVAQGINFTYPVTPGAYDTSHNGGVGRYPANLACDISISKYDSAGTQLLWATYLGGVDDEYPHSLVVDRNDDLVVLGTTYSNNFPHQNAYDDTKAGGQTTDIIVAKFSSDGTTLMGCTYIGGSDHDGLNNGVLKNFYADDYRGDVITDDDGNIYVATVTKSTGMPLKNEVQSTLEGSYDGYLFSLTPDCSDLRWGTYLGGRSQDAFYSIKLDQHEHIYVGGGTNSDDLPTTDTAFSKTINGNIDGVLARFDRNTFELLTMSYWGTSAYDQIYFIDIDTRNNIFATGQTNGAVTQSPGTYGQSNRGQFIIKLDSALSDVELQTTFGNTNFSPNLAPSAFLVDVCDHIYFSGWGSFGPGSTNGMPVTSDAEQSTTDNSDFYIVVLDKDASQLLYATYFGGNVTEDHVDGGTSRFDKRGVIYQSVCSSCPPSSDGQTTEVSDFPTSPGAVFPTNKSVRCSNASFKIDLQIKSAVLADFTVDPPYGCDPLDVQFTNLSVLGDSMIWYFGDGDTSTEIDPMHTYNGPGTYTVKLIVIDSNTCNISSEYERQITVYQNAMADFEAAYDVCSGEFSLENRSENASTFRWDFGDGGSSTERDPEYEYLHQGDFIIKLYVNENTPCWSVDSMPISIKWYEEPKIRLFNAFSPNDDNLNDCFKMEVTSLGCLDYRMRIYNRWGEQVFETTDPDECWNGQVDNMYEILPSGTYFYLINLGNEKQDLEPISGVVELFR